MAGRKSNVQEDGKIIQYTTIKVRLYPTPEQEALFEKTFGCCRYIWNQMLADEQRFYLETDTHFIPTPAKYKPKAAFLKEVDNQALIQEHNQLAQAFRSFFKSPETFGYPRFKRKKEDKDSFTACNQVFGASATIFTTRDGIRMTKAGLVKAKFSRRPRNGWSLKRITVTRARSGKYFCAILYACRGKVPEPVTLTEETTIGLSYSLPHFYVADNGAMADPPRWLNRSREKLAKVQRAMSRMQPGSKNYEAAVQKYRLIHEHIANQRRDFIHKESRRIANEWDAVCVRASDLAEMAQTLRRGNVLDAGFGRFRQCLHYKLERQGKPLLVVDRYAPTTSTCSACGLVREAVQGDERSWTCPACGTTHRREINAAKNIKAQGLAQYFSDGRKSA